MPSTRPRGVRAPGTGVARPGCGTGDVDGARHLANIYDDSQGVPCGGCDQGS